MTEAERELREAVRAAVAAFTDELAQPASVAMAYELITVMSQQRDKLRAALAAADGQLPLPLEAQP